MPIYPGAGGGAKIASGTYIGDQTVNKAIPHSLGVTPKIVLICNLNAGAYLYRIIHANANIYYVTAAASGYKSVTAPDATNFYVGNATGYAQSANATQTHYWVAIG